MFIPLNTIVSGFSGPAACNHSNNEIHCIFTRHADLYIKKELVWLPFVVVLSLSCSKSKVDLNNYSHNMYILKGIVLKCVFTMSTCTYIYPTHPCMYTEDSSQNHTREHCRSKYLLFLPTGHKTMARQARM